MALSPFFQALAVLNTSTPLDYLPQGNHCGYKRAFQEESSKEGKANLHTPSMHHPTSSAPWGHQGILSWNALNNNSSSSSQQQGGQGQGQGQGQYGHPAAGGAGGPVHHAYADHASGSASSQQAYGGGGGFYGAGPSSGQAYPYSLPSINGGLELGYHTSQVNGAGAGLDGSGLPQGSYFSTPGGNPSAGQPGGGAGVGLPHPLSSSSSSAGAGSAGMQHHMNGYAPHHASLHHSLHHHHPSSSLHHLAGPSGSGAAGGHHAHHLHHPHAQYQGQQQQYGGPGGASHMSSYAGRHRVTTTLWEDESTICYQVEARGVCVARRHDNNMVNGTKLLNVCGMSRGKRDGILKNEKERVVVKVGAMHLKGVWIAFDRAKQLAEAQDIAEILFPLFEVDIQQFVYTPENLPRHSAVLAAAQERNLTNLAGPSPASSSGDALGIGGSMGMGALGGSAAGPGIGGLGRLPYTTGPSGSAGPSNASSSGGLGNRLPMHHPSSSLLLQGATGGFGGGAGAGAGGGASSLMRSNTSPSFQFSGNNSSSNGLTGLASANASSTGAPSAGGSSSTASGLPMFSPRKSDSSSSSVLGRDSGVHINSAGSATGLGSTASRPPSISDRGYPSFHDAAPGTELDHTLGGGNPRRVSGVKRAHEDDHHSHPGHHHHHSSSASSHYLNGGGQGAVNGGFDHHSSSSLSTPAGTTNNASSGHAGANQQGSSSSYDGGLFKRPRSDLAMPSLSRSSSTSNNIGGGAGATTGTTGQGHWLDSPSHHQSHYSPIASRLGGASTPTSHSTPGAGTGAAAGGGQNASGTNSGQAPPSFFYGSTSSSSATSS